MYYICPCRKKNETTRHFIKHEAPNATPNIVHQANTRKEEEKGKRTTLTIPTEKVWLIKG
jgi:hypothetical protein